METEATNINNKEKSLHRALERLREQKQQAIAKVVTGELSGEEKDFYIQGLDNEAEKLKTQLEEIGSTTSLKEEAIDYALSFMANAPRIWNNASIEHQAIYQLLLFPKGLTHNLEDNNFGTVEINPLYRLFNTKKDPSNNDESLLVTSRGIEPRLQG